MSRGRNSFVKSAISEHKARQSSETPEPQDSEVSEPQNPETPILPLPTVSKGGRPPGKKSNPNYDTMRFSLPIDLIEKLQAEAFAKRKQKRDTSEIVADLLEERYGVSKFRSPKTPEH